MCCSNDDDDDDDDYQGSARATRGRHEKGRAIPWLELLLRLTYWMKPLGILKEREDSSWVGEGERER